MTLPKNNTAIFLPKHALAIATAMLLAGVASASDSGMVTVELSDRPANTFLPHQAFGAGLDGLEEGDVERLYTPDNIRQMKTAGLKPISYRLRTELGIAVWHWNESGAWSDPVHRQGYWISNDRADAPILLSYGYRLPRRGNTFDQAGNKGYSRLDDGDTRTFWKSNPYLDARYTGERNDLHPQWVVVDLGKPRRINAARILWGIPYATRYQLEYWDGVDPIYVSENPPGHWQPFPNGVIINDKHADDALIRLGQKSLSVRYLRILMSKASGATPPGSQDIRDGLGYAIRELYIGELDRKGRFHDVIRHGKDKDRQTVTYASSTDPWHRAVDRDPDIEQPGLDLVFRSGLTHDLPLLTPVGLLYDTPENAAAEIRFLKARGYPVVQIEMGEEPDGQYMTPEDYGALYAQWAQAIHAIDPALQLGGPGFQTAIYGWQAWPDANGNRSWMNRFLNYLRNHERLKDFNFFSFEWYPFDNVCEPPAPQLAAAPALLTDVMQLLQQEGTPTDIPWIITEYGYSAFAGQVEVDMPSALLNAEILAQFLTLGGDTAYLYGYQPNTPIHEWEECNTWGNLMMFLADDKGRIRASLPTYHGARLLAQEWAQPLDRPHALYRASADLHDPAGQPVVTAYAVYRPDRQWGLLLINKDPRHEQAIQVRFRGPSQDSVAFLQDTLDVFQYSPRQYRWRAQEENGHPLRNDPPTHFTLPGAANTRIVLPPFSLTVIRGRGPEPMTAVDSPPQR